VEAVVWVLAYVTLADIEYKDRTIAISPLGKIKYWFRDGESSLKVHVSLKRLFHMDYGCQHWVTDRYSRYFGVIQLFNRLYGTGPTSSRICM